MSGDATGHDDVYDLAVIGAGPCGIAVGVAARQAGLRCMLFDKGAVTDSVFRYPTYTTFFSGAEKLEIGGVPFTTAGDKPTRREALRYFRRVVQFHGVEVRQYEEVLWVEGAEGGFVLRTRRLSGQERTFRARAVVVATGYFDTPRRLDDDIPGASLAKVVYYFREPFPYWGQEVLVVGGGNSAADAALTTWREGGKVRMAHLFAELDKGIKPWVRPDIENRIAEGAIPVFWRHRVVEIRWDEVDLEDLETGERKTIANDWVLAMTGYVPDTGFLRGLGVEVDAETGIPAHDRATMRTNVPGIYIAGVIAAGFDANKIFIENGKEHGPLIVADRLAGASR
jgi:thioredoxin reductase (NADPH)